MPYCRNCGKEITEEQKYCPHCGTGVNSNVKEKYEHLKMLSDIKQKNTNQDTKKKYSDSSGSIWVLIGLISSILSLFFFPPAFGIFGIFCGSMAVKRGSSFSGGFIILLSLICMIIGIIYGAVVMQEKMKEIYPY